MWGIGEAKVRQGIAQKQVTEVVNTTGRRYRMVWEQRKAECNRRNEQQDYSQVL